MASPGNARRGWSNLCSLTDDIWHHAGDKATDVSVRTVALKILSTMQNIHEEVGSLSDQERDNVCCKHDACCEEQRAQETCSATRASSVAVILLCVCVILKIIPNSAFSSFFEKKPLKNVRPSRSGVGHKNEGGG